MAPVKDRASAKIAELAARGLTKGAPPMAPTPTSTPAARILCKASAVVIPVYRSVEEIRGPAGASLLLKVDLPLETVLLPCSSGRGRGGAADANDISPNRHTDNGGSSTQGATLDTQDALAADGATLTAASMADVEADVAAAITGLPPPKLTEPHVGHVATAGTATAAKTVAAAATATGPHAPPPPRRPPGFPSPEPADNPSTGAHGLAMAGGPLAAEAPVSHSANPTPAAPGTPPERVPVPSEHSAQEHAQPQDKDNGNLGGSAGVGGKSGGSGLDAQQRLSPAPPRTPQPTLPAAAGPTPPSNGMATPSQPHASPAATALAAVTQSAQRPSGAAGNANRPAVGVGHADADGHSGMHGIGGAAAAASAPPGFPMDRGYLAYVQQQHLQQQHMAQQQLLLEQQQQQQLEYQRQLQYQQQYELYQHQLAQQQQYQELYRQQMQAAQQQQPQAQQPQTQQAHRQQAQQRPGQGQGQGPHPRQQGGRQQGPAPPPVPPSTQRPPDQPRPPQRPRPCAAFGADVKGVEIALARSLALLFRREPKLFREVYGFDLDWWLGARGKPLSETGDDLLVAMVFHNYAAVVVRLDRGAAPGWAGCGRHQPLNPTASALLNERVYGNALMLRVFKLDGPADGGANGGEAAAPGGSGGPALHLQHLTPAQVHSCVLESDNVTWQMDWYRELAPGLAESLSCDERGGWLAKLPVTPLDGQGNPDVGKALAVLRDTFKLPPGVTRGSRAAAQASEEGAAAMNEAVPAELAPLLRAMRCSSPWCLPSRRRGMWARRGGVGPCCPFGHFWRSLDLGERGGVRGLNPVFNAARYCAGRPLEPGLCPSLVDRLARLGWGVAAVDDEAEALSEAGREAPNPIRAKLPDLAFAGAASAVSPNAGNGTLAPGAAAAGSRGADGEVVTADDEVEEDDDEEDEEESDDTPAPRPKSRMLRPEDLTFYLSFCREGPRCRRCHSVYELMLAATLQRLTGAASGGGRDGGTDAAHATRRDPHRRGFEVLAALSDDAEFHAHAVAKPAAAAAAAADTATAVSGAAVDVTALAAAAAAAAVEGLPGDGGSSGRFNWADEPEPAAEAGQAMAAERAAPPPQQRPPRSAAFARAPPAPSTRPHWPQRPPPPSYPPPGAAKMAAPPPQQQPATAWSSCAPISCHPGDSSGGAVAAATASSTGDFPRSAPEWPPSQRHHDPRPMPNLPDSLDLDLDLNPAVVQHRTTVETAVVPDRTAVAASMVAKSRNGVYVPPHLRACADGDEAEATTKAEAAAEDEPQPVSEAMPELPPAELNRTALEAEAAPLTLEQPPSSAALSHASAPPAPAAPPAPGPAREPHRVLGPPGFQQSQPPGQAPAVPVPIPVPIPSPVPVPVPVAAAPTSLTAPEPQSQGTPYDGPAPVLRPQQQQEPSSASLIVGHGLLAPPAPLTPPPDAATTAVSERPSAAADAEDVLVDCMSFCGLSSSSLADGGAAAPQPQPAPPQAPSVPANVNGPFVYDGYGGLVAGGGGGGRPPMPSYSHSPHLAPPPQPGLHLPPYVMGPGPYQGYHAEGPPSQPQHSLFSGPHPGASYGQQQQPGGLLPPRWPQQQPLSQPLYPQQQHQAYQLPLPPPPQQQQLLQQQQDLQQQQVVQHQQQMYTTGPPFLQQGPFGAGGSLYGAGSGGLLPPQLPQQQPPLHLFPQQQQQQHGWLPPPQPHPGMPLEQQPATLQGFEALPQQQQQQLGFMRQYNPFAR